MSFNWNDLKFLLELLRQKRISLVADTLNTDPTTVSRHIKALEKSLGTKLFKRIDGQYYATDILKQALSEVASAERQLMLFEDKLLANDQHLTGTIRVTSVHTFINHYLITRLPDFFVKYPQIELEIIADSSQLDLGRHEADIAIRMGRPEQGSLVTRRLCVLYYAVYGKETLLQNQQELYQLPWVLFEKRYQNLPEAVWQQQHFPQAKARLRCNVGPAMYNAVSAGIGIACLPCYMALCNPALRCINKPFGLRELWLLMHQEKRQIARIRVFIDWLETQLLADEHLFRGNI